jgi:hypothetical protein
MMFKKTDFSQYIKNSFAIGASGNIMRSDEPTVEEVDEVVGDDAE